MKLARDRHVQNTSIHSHTQNSQYIGSAFVQPSVYSVTSGISLPSFNQPPVQLSHYNPPPSMFKPGSNVQPVNIQYINQSTSYQVQPAYNPESGIGGQGLQNYYAVNSTAINSV
jgi:hypothetical protein